MLHFQDTRNRSIRLTDERLQHPETDHLEMTGQTSRIAETLVNPELTVRSRTDSTVELIYEWYAVTPVAAQFLRVAMKALRTAYYTDAVKEGNLLGFSLLMARPLKGEPSLSINLKKHTISQITRLSEIPEIR